MSQVLLSFDIEEFDFPRERGQEFSLEEGIKVSKEGTIKILDLLKKQDVKATFFTTGNFAENEPEIIKRMIKEGHEVAAHGVDHFNPKKTDIKNAKKILEKISGQKIFGWRQPRMQKIDYSKLHKNGFLYDSSVNPAFIPGRYNNLKVSKRPYYITIDDKNSILEIPASAATTMRIPTFWLALHLFPYRFYLSLAKNSLKKTGLFVTYFHPWEFTDLSKYKIVPWYIKKNSNEKLVNRLERLIKDLKKSSEFITYHDYYQIKENNKDQREL